MEKKDNAIKQSTGGTPQAVTLTIKICGSIETPPHNSREAFRQGVIDTVLELMKKGEFTVEYIGYQPDKAGSHFLHTETSEYEDCIYASFHVNNAGLNPMGQKLRREDIINTFARVFEDKTNRQLEVDSTLLRKGKRQRIIEMSSDWRYYRKHA